MLQAWTVTDDARSGTCDFLLRLATDLVAAGEPVTLIEPDIRRLGATLGHPDVQVAAGPTTVFLAESPRHPLLMASVGPSLRLDQSALVTQVHRDLRERRISTQQAWERLVAVRTAPDPFPFWMRSLGYLLVTLGLVLVLQPGLPNLAVAALGSLLVTALMAVAGRHTVLGALLPSVAAFGVATLAFGAYDAGLLEGPLRTVICPLAVLLPGALLVTGVTELATGSMTAGSSRVFYGLVQLVLFSLGLVGAAVVTGVDDGAFANHRVAGPGVWALPAGLALITCGMAISEALPWRLLRWSALVLAATFVAQLGTQAATDSLPLGGFAGAVVAAWLPTLLSRLREDVPRLVTFLPSFWLLVPGTLGVMGVTQLGAGTAGSAVLVGAGGVVSAIALGLLVGAALSLPLSRETQASQGTMSR